ncbi:fimbrial protein [Serratia proteamaculans]|uniref:fimbrial protein n=1 Tax=Serratia proteamaculans TaxID=28151 RepID=UPI0039B00708
MIKPAGAVFLLPWLLISIAASQASVDIAVEGTLLPPVCRVDDGGNGMINVDFGDDINLNRLDGDRYRTNVSYSVTCGDDGQRWPLRLKFTSAAIGWDAKTLATDRQHLGIRLALGGTDVEFGKDIPVADPARLPLLTAVPVKDPAGIPEEGRFSATASLLAEYY